MKHVGKIYILLGIIFICLVIPVNTNEGFKGFFGSSSTSTNLSSQEYKNSIKSMNCKQLKEEKKNRPSGSNEHRIAKNMYTSRNCKEMLKLKKQLKEVDENALKVSDIGVNSPSSVK